MKILVTGANGYLGQGIVKQLLDDGIEVVAADTVCDRVDKRALIKETDIFKVEDPMSFFGHPDVLLHLAWRNGFVHNDHSHIEDLPGHFSFLLKFIEKGIHQVAVMGSMHEIGFHEGSIDEHTPADPMTLYGISKNALRKAIELECKKNGVVYQWLRGYYIVGNPKYGSSIFSKIYKAEEEGKTAFPFTSGENQYDFLDYDVFCQQVAACLEQDETDGIINICSGEPEKLSSRVERFLKENDMKIRLEYGKFPDRPYDSKAIWGDNTKIKKIMERRG